MNQTSTSLKSGEIVGPYTITRLVGSGGMGEVYQAWDEDLKRNVAIKILTPGTLADDEIRNRFMAEGRSLARLKHPNVVNLYMLGQHDGRPYMAMEFVDGMTLDDFIALNSSGLNQMLELFKQMVEGLGAAHREQIIHRDIKPQNIMVDIANTVRIVDFGIAKSHLDNESPLTQQGIILGTKNYMAPELLKGVPATPQSDIYSLGLVLAYMLTGEAPRSADVIVPDLNNTRVMQSKRLRDLLPPELQNILAGMTHKSPELRYANTQEILNDLKDVNLDVLHSDLLVEGDTGVSIENKDKVIEQCRQNGFDKVESRLVMNLAAKLETQTLAMENLNTSGKQRQIILDDNAIELAMERIKAAKTQVVAKRVAHVLNGPPDTSDFYVAAKRSHWRQIVFLAALVGGGYYATENTHLNLEKRFWDSIGLKDPRQAVAAPPGAASVPARQAFASAGRPSTAPKASEAEILAPVPKPKIGQTFQYTYELVNTDSGMKEQAQILEWELAATAGGRNTWTDSHNTAEVFGVNPFVPPFQSSGNGFREPQKNRIWPDPSSLFPLVESKVIKFTVTPAAPATPYELTCKVYEKTRTSTTAGSFKTVPVGCTSNGKNLAKEMYFYAPQLNHWVKREATFTHGAREQRLTVDLIGYAVPTGPAPLAAAPALTVPARQPSSK